MVTYDAKKPEMSNAPIKTSNPLKKRTRVKKTIQAQAR
jgi:hypothetical protein